MFKIIGIAWLLVLTLSTQDYYDPGLPPGGDPDVDEVPLDNSLWILILTGGLYGITKSETGIKVNRKQLSQ